MYSRTVRGEEAKKIYNDIRELCRTVDVSNVGVKDEDLVKKVLGRNLITEPINKGEPFNINNNTTRDGFRGQDFSVESLMLIPKDTINGGRYEVQFVATNFSGEFMYELDASIIEWPSAIRIKKSRIDAV